MGRRLPEYDPDKDGEYATSKRRTQIFKRIYQNLQHWRAQQEDHGMSPILTTIDGEDVYYYDLMVGQDTLPERQRQAFELICLKGYTESKATAIMLPNSKWSTPVQQYSDDGLKKMIAAYDAKQDGTWDPEAAKKKRRSPTRKRENVTSLETSSEVPENAVDAGPSAPKQPRNWDWSTWSEDHESLAAYITAHGVEISPAQVKAVSFLRKAWYEDPEQVEQRKARKAERARQRDKFANETPEQRRARHQVARREKSLQTQKERLEKAEAEIRELRVQAGLDPDTGAPVGNN